MASLRDHLFPTDRPESRGFLLFFKIFEALIVAFTIYYAWYWGRYILRISDVVLPLGIAQYIDVRFMFGNSLPLINAALISGLMVIGFFRLSRWAYLGGFLLLHWQYATRFTLGEIPHSGNLVGMAVLGFAIAALAFEDGRYRRRFVIGYNYFFVGLGYTLAGICKLIGTGLHWSDGSHLWMWVHEKGIDAFAKWGVLDFNLLQDTVLAHYPIATLFLTIGLVSELSAFLMWWRPFRLPVGLAVLGLHVGIFLIMGILFAFSMAIVTMLTFPWARWFDHFLEASADPPMLGSLTAFSTRFA
ncbi:MAG: hypothetical protein AAF970_02405 [Bacteroidota bacterium]